MLGYSKTHLHRRMNTELLLLKSLATSSSIFSYCVPDASPNVISELIKGRDCLLAHSYFVALVLDFNNV